MKIRYEDEGNLRQIFSFEFFLLALLFSGTMALWLGVTLHDAAIRWLWPVTISNIPTGILEYAKPSVHQLRLTQEVRDWLKESRMRVKPDLEVREIKFRSAKDAIIFKMRWM